jgi:hypothetical protein
MDIFLFLPSRYPFLLRHQFSVDEHNLYSSGMAARRSVYYSICKTMIGIYTLTVTRESTVVYISCCSPMGLPRNSNLVYRMYSGRKGTTQFAPLPQPSLSNKMRAPPKGHGIKTQYSYISPWVYP